MMNGLKVSCSLSCKKEPQCIKELCLTSADKKENVNNQNLISTLRISNNEDLIELLPRRTAELLQSPWHRDMRPTSKRDGKESKNSVYSTPRQSKDLKKAPNIRLDQESKNLHSEKSSHLEPRRINELLQSPWHRDMRPSSIRVDKESKNIYSEKCNYSSEKSIYSEPRRNKESIQSPCHKDMISSCIRLDPKSKNLHSEKSTHLEPRRINELLQSPWHRDMRPSSISVNKESKNLNSEKCIYSSEKSIYSEPRRNKESIQSPCHKDMISSCIRLDPESKNLHSEKSTHLEPRRINELLQSPWHRDMRPSSIRVDKESNNISSEPRRIKELLESPIHKEEASKARPVRRKLEFDKQNIDKMLSRITNYLQEISAFQGISKRSIQQLGIQDFINIFSHLLSHTEISLKSLDKSNYIEKTIYAMKQLNYPHKVRKSWLLMPSASLQHVLQLLDFLMNFVKQ